MSATPWPSSTTTSCPATAASTRPLLAVVGGSTGAGKSTLVNALVGHPVTRAGCHPAHHPPAHPAAPPRRRGLVRGPAGAAGPGPDPRHRAVPPAPAAGRQPTAGAGPRPGAVSSLVLLADAAVPAGIALLDAPDVDSISEDNRRLAGQLLAAADLWIFVTTANRYADAVPWRLLLDAASRDIMVAVVLDRVPPRPKRRSARTCRPCSAGRAWAQPGCSWCRKSALDAIGDAAAGRRGAAAVLARGTSPPTPPAGPTSPAAPSTAPSGRWASRVEAVGAGGPGPGTRGRGPRAGRPRAPTRTPWPGSWRPPGTGRCCAARSWPAGRTSSARASSSGPWNRTSDASGTGWARSSGANRRPPSGWKPPSKPGCRPSSSMRPPRPRRTHDQRWRSDPAGRQLLGTDDLSGTSPGLRRTRWPPKSGPGRGA